MDRNEEENVAAAIALAQTALVPAEEKERIGKYDRGALLEVETRELAPIGRWEKIEATGRYNMTFTGLTLSELRELQPMFWRMGKAADFDKEVRHEQDTRQEF